MADGGGVAEQHAPVERGKDAHVRLRPPIPQRECSAVVFFPIGVEKDEERLPTSPMTLSDVPDRVSVETDEVPRSHLVQAAAIEIRIRHQAVDAVDQFHGLATRFVIECAENPSDKTGHGAQVGDVPLALALVAAVAPSPGKSIDFTESVACDVRLQKIVDD